MSKPIEITLSISRELPDPRVERTKIHNLEVIMFIALCSYLSGADGFYDMEDYAHAKCEWLRDHIGMQSVPSHDTFNRVFQAISPVRFGECLIELSRRLLCQLARSLICPPHVPSVCDCPKNVPKYEKSPYDLFIRACFLLAPRDGLEPPT